MVHADVKKKQEVKYTQLELELQLPPVLPEVEAHGEDTANAVVFDTSTCEWIQL